MRVLKQLQRALREEKIYCTTGEELDEMGRILESSAGISMVYEAVIQDLARGKQSAMAARCSLL